MNIERRRGKFDTDLFASEDNKWGTNFVTWGYNPQALACDAFSLTWDMNNVLIFPPFSLIGRVLRKVREDGPRGLLIAPVWRTQPWWTALQKLMVGRPVFYIPVAQGTLVWPGQPDRTFPLQGRMALVAVEV
jgi:hypothetical protein